MSCDAEEVDGRKRRSSGAGGEKRRLSLDKEETDDGMKRADRDDREGRTSPSIVKKQKSSLEVDEEKEKEQEKKCDTLTVPSRRRVLFEGLVDADDKTDHNPNEARAMDSTPAHKGGKGM